MFADDVTSPENQPQKKKPGVKTKAELYAIDPDTLSTDELERRTAFKKADKEDIDLENALDTREKSRLRKAGRFDELKSRGREIVRTKHDQEQAQSRCTHRKGGRGIGAIVAGEGTASDYSVIRHLMPWNEILQRCTRCGKTWRAPNTLDFAMDTQEGQGAFLAAQVEYKTALAWPTDNTMSTGITFQHHSTDGDVSARKFVHETVKDVTLR